MVVVVVSLHECLVYYRNSVDRDAEKKKCRAPPYQTAVGGWSTTQHGKENKRDSCEETKQKMYAKRENGKIMYLLCLFIPQTESDGDVV